MFTDIQGFKESPTYREIQSEMFFRDGEWRLAHYFEHRYFDGERVMTHRPGSW